MPSKDDIQLIKDELQATGAMYVKDTVWPHDSPRLLVIGSLMSDMDVAALADDLYMHLGIVATPLPKKDGLSNLYPFIMYKATPTAQLYDEASGQFIDIPVTSGLVEACFGGETPIVDYKVAFVGLGILEAKVTPKEVADAIAAADFWSLPLDTSEEPIPFGATDVLAPNTWVFLRADFVSMSAIPPKGLKTTLEKGDWNYKAINPLGGISGLFERLFSAEEYVGKDYSHVLFNPGNAAGVTTKALRSNVFGSYMGKVYLSAFTTEEVIANQGHLDTFYAIQGTEEGAGDAFKGLLEVLQKALKSIRYILYGVIGAGLLWAGWNIAKYVRKEAKEYDRG